MTARAVGDYARLDVDRQDRTGVPEVVFAADKTPEQTLQLLRQLREESPQEPALATRCPDAVLDAAEEIFDPVRVDREARTVLVDEPPRPRGEVLVLTAGTTDIPVAREAVVTLDFLGAGAELVPDVGIAGLHRVLGVLHQLRAADCVIVAAGMDGALPTVVAGLVDAPVIGVPTSVGYGVAAGGAAAAATMLAACAPGLVVVNIDNGFGAAAHAAKVLRVGRRG